MFSDVRSGRHAAKDYGDTPLLLQADVCIIGAGAGGAAAAAAIAATGKSVAVLEEGSHFKPSDFKPDTAWAFRNLYQNKGLRSLRGNNVMPLPGGKGVGGSTLINSAIAFRCPPSVLAHWRDEHGLHTVDDTVFDAYFERIFRTIGVTVNPVQVQRNNNLVFKQGADALGLPGDWLARSAPGCVGCGICQYGCPSGGKFSVDRTFLTEAVATGNVGVYANVRVRGVTRAAGRITSVTGSVIDPETQTTQQAVQVVADHFLLAAGAVGSPLFLLANGLASNVHCGRHLVVHPTASALARFDWEIKPWSGVTQGFYVDMYDEGYLLQTYTVTPDQTFLLLQGDDSLQSLQIMRDLRFHASAGVLVHDEDSEGRVQHTPVGPDLSYQLGPSDRERLILGLRKTAEVFFAAGAQRVHPARVGLASIDREEDIEAALPLDLPASSLLLYASHPMGTCRMGSSPDRGVIDPHGRVWDTDNLYIADASVFPSSLGVNPQVTTMAMGLMVGEHIGGLPSQG